MRRLLSILGAMGMASAVHAGDIVSLRTGTAAFTVGESGFLTAIAGNGRNYVATNRPAPVMQVRVTGKDYAPAIPKSANAANRFILSVRP